MSDIIQLLPDAIANQIAAGEVIQRPASVVKELMENAIDAGSNSVKLILKDAGKTLIQVTDDGCGMSETDARMSFERHATSKIRTSKDLFAIRTMGFRGEALASIAAIAQVELRTRRRTDELGTRIVIEGSELMSHEADACAAGTSFLVKNLFFNVPARRNFLKSNPVEMRHILDEFQRISLAHPDVFFSLHHNNVEMFHLPAGNLRQRITRLLGTAYDKRLVPVEEETEVLSIKGFIGKPEFAKKSRGEQLFFVNHRFIKSPYLHHAVMTAYEELVSKENFPLYVLFLDIDPARIDINVHPTKQEIKFDDEKLVYNYLKVAVRHALGQNHVTPTLDFEQENNITRHLNFEEEYSEPQEETSANNYRPTQTQNFVEKAAPNFGQKNPSARQERNLKHWQQLYEGTATTDDGEADLQPVTIGSQWADATNLELDDAGGSFSKPQKEPYQIHNSYVVSQIKSGFLLIDQQAAHERILYEKYLEQLDSQQSSAQQQLFPKNVTLPPADANLLKEILPQLHALGFDVEEFGGDTFIVRSLPALVAEGNRDEQKIIENLLEQYKQDVDLQLDANESIARSLARSTALKRGHALAPVEMQTLIDKLFACQMPFHSPFGQNCFLTYELDDLRKKFIN